jgi:hypothetical protein
MDRRDAARRGQLLADAEIDPRIPRGVLPRLERFLDPFLPLLQRSDQGLHARHYIAGLLSGLESENVESIAYLHDQPREPCSSSSASPPGTTSPGSPSWPVRRAANWAARVGLPFNRQLPRTCWHGGPRGWPARPR